MVGVITIQYHIKISMKWKFLNEINLFFFNDWVFYFLCLFSKILPLFHPFMQPVVERLYGAFIWVPSMSFSTTLVFFSFFFLISAFIVLLNFLYQLAVCVCLGGHFHPLIFLNIITIILFKSMCDLLWFILILYYDCEISHVWRSLPTRLSHWALMWVMCLILLCLVMPCSVDITGQPDLFWREMEEE